MTVRELINTKGAVVGQDGIEPFQAAFRGEMIRPGNAGYESARKIWNASINKYPGLIARCSGLADGIAAVNFARENELLVAVRGGGHNVGGRALCDGGIVIDLSRMKGVHVDAKNRRARVQGGATLGDELFPSEPEYQTGDLNPMLDFSAMQSELMHMALSVHKKTAAHLLSRCCGVTSP